MEKFLLCGILARDKLDVVHQQNIGFAVFLMEFAGGAPADGFDQLIGEIVPFDVQGGHFRMIFLDIIADGVQQVGFSQTGIPIDKQRVIGTGRVRGHRQGCRVGEFIRRTHDIRIKGKFIFRIDGQVIVGLALF